MIDVTFAQLQGWLLLFLWPFVRIMAFIAASPLWGDKSVPRQVQIGLGAVLALVIAPTLPPSPDIPLFSIESFGILVQQMLIGTAMGVVLRVMIAVVQAAGEFIGLQMGLAFATFFAPDVGNTMVLSRLMQMLTLLMFLALNGHLMTIEILAATFDTLPIGNTPLDASFGEILARWGGTIFTSGMLLAIPLIASLLTINLSLGILNRASPQLSIFSVGFPMTLTVGLILLMVLMPNLARFLEGLFGDSLVFMQALVEQMNPAID
ncbi:flagellar biosynthetic protein FliR [Halomonas shantousis]